jgi:type II secretory pathway pseudopilin PulG
MKFIKLNLQKGAMFGLDARIALAIFGALSVISGAALYSAIQEAKVTAIINTAKEIEKAIEQYYLDTGSLPPHSTGNSSRDLSAIALKVKPSGITNWKGPYYPFSNAATEYFVYNGINITLPYRTSSSWTDTTSNDTCLKSSSSCHIYIWFNISDISIQRALEEKIDGNVTSATSDLTGNFRFSSAGIRFKTNIFYDPELAPTP